MNARELRQYKRALQQLNRHGHNPVIEDLPRVLAKERPLTEAILERSATAPVVGATARRADPLRALTDAEYAVWALCTLDRFALRPLSKSAIARLFKISEARVRQLYSAALAKLQCPPAGGHTTKTGGSPHKEK